MNKTTSKARNTKKSSVKKSKPAELPPSYYEGQKKEHKPQLDIKGWIIPE